MTQSHRSGDSGGQGLPVDPVDAAGLARPSEVASGDSEAALADEAENGASSARAEGCAGNAALGEQLSSPLRSEIVAASGVEAEAAGDEAMAAAPDASVASEDAPAERLAVQNSEPSPEGLGARARTGGGTPTDERAAVANEIGAVAEPLGPETAGLLTPDPGASQAPPSTPLARGQQMRERLLARATAYEMSSPRSALGLDEFDEVMADSAALPRNRELNLIAAPPIRPPAAPTPRLAGKRTGSQSPLSANWIALFGTLLGLASIATIVAMLINLAPEPRAIQWQPLLQPRVTESAEDGAEGPAPSTKPSEPKAVPKKQRVRIPGPWRVSDAAGDPGVRTIKGTVGREPFLRAIQDAGLPKREAYRALTALKGLRDFDNCGRRDQFVALLDRSSKRLKAFEYIVSPEEVYQAKEGNDGLLLGAKLDLKVERARVDGAFTYLGKKVDDSAVRAGLEGGLASALGQAFEGHLNLSELERGDRIRFIGQEVTVLGEFARYAGIEVAQLRRADPKAKVLTVYYFRGSKSRGHYDQDAKAPYEGGWRKPVPGAPVTSKFNMKRMHPVLHKIMPHTGTDFGAPMGAVVGASSPGTVAYIGYAGASGNFVRIEHANGYETGYAHLSRFAEGLKVGDKVQRMQVVGYVGSTGRSTGPHLHFVAKKDGEFIDPESLNLDGMRVLPSDERDEFQAVRKKYDEMLSKIAWPELPEGVMAAASEAQEQVGTSESIAMGGGENEKEPSVPDDDLGMGVEGPANESGGEGDSEPSGSGSEVYLTDAELRSLASGKAD